MADQIMTKKILFAAHDPSSGNIGATLGKATENHSSLHFTFIASGPSKEILSKAGLHYLDGDQNDDLVRVAAALKPAAVITGASRGDTIERQMVLWARRQQIPSISILDFWVNYAERYSDEKKREKFAYLPNYIFIMDELARQDMLALGFPEEKLIITGNPFFDTFRKPAPRGITLKNTQKRILCISNPEQVITSHGELAYLFDPGVADDLLEIISNRSLPPQAAEVTVVIRLHPKDDQHAFEKHFSGRANVSLEQGSSLDSSLDQAYVVIGNYSTVLFQAVLQGKTVISYRKNIPPEKDDFIGRRLGICHSAYSLADFKNLIIMAIQEELLPLPLAKVVDNNSTSRVLQKIEEILQGVAATKEKIIVGNNINIVPFSQKHLHAPEYFSWLKDKKVIQFARMDYDLNIPFSDVQKYVESLWNSNHDFFFAIETKRKEFIGTLKVCRINWTTKIADLGVLIGNKSYWGKGLATEALSLAISFCFDTLELQKVTCGCTELNKGMQKVALKLGFQQEGFFRSQDLIEGTYYGHYYYGLLREEYKENNKNGVTLL